MIAPHSSLAGGVGGLVERGAMPPVLTSPVLVGRAESERLFEAAYADHARRVAGRLRGAASPDDDAMGGGRA